MLGESDSSIGPMTLAKPLSLIPPPSKRVVFVNYREGVATDVCLSVDDIERGVVSLCHGKAYRDLVDVATSLGLGVCFKIDCVWEHTPEQRALPPFFVSVECTAQAAEPLGARLGGGGSHMDPQGPLGVDRWQQQLVAELSEEIRVYSL